MKVATQIGYKRTENNHAQDFVLTQSLIKQTLFLTEKERRI